MSDEDPKRKLFTVVHALDKPGEHAKNSRVELMGAHLSYIEEILDHLIVAGPMFADDNKTIVGSILIYNTDDKNKALKYLKADPYYSADIWKDISVNVFRGAAGDAVGGKAY